MDWAAHHLNRKIWRKQNTHRAAIKDLIEYQATHDFKETGWGSHHHVEFIIDSIKESIKNIEEEIKEAKRERREMQK